jgi:hypothetical protein
MIVTITLCVYKAILQHEDAELSMSSRNQGNAMKSFLKMLVVDDDRDIQKF